MQVKFGLKMVLECWDREFLGTTTIFQKTNISWPLQPPTERVLNFNMIFHDSTHQSWKWIIKNSIFTDIWYSFCQRLLRPADVNFLKNGCATQKFSISAFQNHLQTKFNLHIFICQSQFISAIPIWDTLYLCCKILSVKFF